MKVVNWSFLTNVDIGSKNHDPIIELLIPANYKPFKRLSTDIASSRKGATHLKCPAFTDFIKNTFIFSAPFNINIDIEVDKKTGFNKIYCENISQQIFDKIIDTRFLLKSKLPVVGIDWLSVFKSNEPLTMQILPAFLHNNDFTSKASIIPGEFDIGKWTRPIEAVFELKTTKDKINIKQGDALYYAKFLTTEKVELEEFEIPWKDIEICNNIRQADTFRPLKERYQALKNFKSNACPYKK